MNIVKKPILMVLGLIICLAMGRLGVWQLDRAEQKQALLDQSTLSAAQVPVDLLSLADQLASSSEVVRFRQVTLSGRYLAEQSILIDNQVIDSLVGYWLITPFALQNSNQVVMVNRGWLPVGQSRDILPTFITDESKQTLFGRLNTPPAKPPLWNEQYAIAQGVVWQYLSIDKFAQQTQLEVLPLVVELAPDDEAVKSAETKLIRRWPEINDKWVGKHKAYALQWFSMALAFFIACLILLIRSRKQIAD